jgi:predicted outer membrane lipoprotein
MKLGAPGTQPLAIARFLTVLLTAVFGIANALYLAEKELL